MSDPVSNAEIEDVLSSIRRLVSVDHKSGAKLGIKMDAEEQASLDDDQDQENDAKLSDADEAYEITGETKLLLTRALRVEDDTSDETEDQNTPSEYAASDTQNEEADELSEALLRLEEYAEAQADNFEEADEAASESATVYRLEPSDYARDVDEPDEHGSDSDEFDTIDTVFRHTEMGEGRGERSESEWLTEPDPRVGEVRVDGEDWPEDALEDDLTDVPNAEVSVSPEEDEQWNAAELNDQTDTPEVKPESALEARIAEVEAAVAARKDQWDPDAAEQDDYAGGEVDPLPWEDHAPEGDTEARIEIVEEVTPEQAEAIEEATVLEQAIDAINDSVSFSDTGSSTPELIDHMAEITASDMTGIPVSIDAADSLEEAISAAAENAAEHEATSAAAAAVASATRDAGWYSDDTVIDEDALRDLVSDIVRQELQGALGERITRNVRKLVRREIHRAMMGQDYD